MMKLIQDLKTNDSGATAIEYGLIAALVAVGLIGTLSTLGDDLTDTYSDISTELTAGDE